jgi:hypothetical protein
VSRLRRPFLYDRFIFVTARRLNTFRPGTPGVSEETVAEEAVGIRNGADLAYFINLLSPETSEAFAHSSRATTTFLERDLGSTLQSSADVTRPQHQKRRPVVSITPPSATPYP